MWTKARVHIESRNRWQPAQSIQIAVYLTTYTKVSNFNVYVLLLISCSGVRLTGQIAPLQLSYKGACTNITSRAICISSLNSCDRRIPGHFKRRCSYVRQDDNVAQSEKCIAVCCRCNRFYSEAIQT